MSELSKLTAKAVRVTGLSRRTFYRWVKMGIDIRQQIEGVTFGKWWKVSEVAKLFNVNKSSIYRWIDNGLFKIIRVGNSIRISDDSVRMIAGKLNDESV